MVGELASLCSYWEVRSISQELMHVFMCLSCFFPPLVFFCWFFLACEKRNVTFKIQIKNLEVIAKYSKCSDPVNHNRTHLPLQYKRMCFWCTVLSFNGTSATENKFLKTDAVLLLCPLS